RRPEPGVHVPRRVWRKENEREDRNGAVARDDAAARRSRDRLHATPLNEKARGPCGRAGLARASPGHGGSSEAASRTGGEGGIRTLDTLTGITVFETARFNHSRTSPPA